VLDAGRGGFNAGHYDAEHGEPEQIKEITELLKQGVIKKLKATASSPAPVASSTSMSTKAETRRRRRAGGPLRAADTVNSGDSEETQSQCVENDDTVSARRERNKSAHSGPAVRER
jgi:hypothetical protein